MSETTPVVLNANIPTDTPWGDVHCGLNTMGTGETMATWLNDLGPLGGDVSITTAAGEKLELKDVYGRLYNILKKEPSLTVEFPLMQLSEKTRGILWDVEKTGTGSAAKVKVYSLVNNAHMSFALWCPLIPASETFEAPKCLASLDLAYSASAGFSGKVVVEILRAVRAGVAPEDVELFQFGIAEAIATTAPVENQNVDQTDVDQTDDQSN